MADRSEDIKKKLRQPNIEEKGKIQTAARKGDLTTLQQLHSSGVDVTGDLNGEGWTALHSAAEWGRYDAAVALLNWGAEVDAVTRGIKRTPLHWAARQNHPHVMSLLISHGADVNMKDLDGFTPLVCAVDNGSSAAVYYLIKEVGVDPTQCPQWYQGDMKRLLKMGEESKQQVDRDVTNSSKWPVAEKVAKALFASPLPSHLECEICLDVLDDPVMTTCCGQSYCKECIGKVRNKVCPHCRGKIETFPDKKSVRLINELKICCPYHIDDKCQWKGAPSELLNHLSVCDIKPIMCPHGCGKQLEKNNMRLHAEFDCSLRLVSCIHCWKKVKDKDMAKHTSGCPKMPLPCPNKCSAPKVITREEMKRHLEVCPDQVVACKYSELGCQQKMKRKELDQHMSTAMQHHLDLVAKRAIREENARKQLEYANKQLEEKVASLEAMMTKLMNK